MLITMTQVLQITLISNGCKHLKTNMFNLYLNLLFESRKRKKCLWVNSHLKYHISLWDVLNWSFMGYVNINLNISSLSTRQIKFFSINLGGNILKKGENQDIKRPSIDLGL